MTSKIHSAAPAKITSRPSANRALTSLCVALLVVISMAPPVLALTPEQATTLVQSGRVAPELIERLGEVDRVGARVLFTVPGDAQTPLPVQSQMPEDIDPIVVDLVQHFLPGSEMSMSRSEIVRSLTGVVNSSALLGLLKNHHVLAIELEEGLTPQGGADIQNLSDGSHTVCRINATTGCVEGGDFSIRVSRSGVFQPHVLSSGSSAIFYFSSSGNWEVLAKVLNGCGINNRYWVFAAGATTQSFAVQVEEIATHVTKTYSSSQCPIVDTSAFTC